MPRAPRRPAALAVVLVLAACSSTTQLDAGSGSPLGPSPVDAVSPPPTAPTALPSDPVGAAGPGAPAPAPGAAAAAGAAGGAAAVPGNGGPVGSAGAPGPLTSSSHGVTDDTITIGIRHFDERGMAAFAAAYGISGTLPDPGGYAAAVVADTNERGGIARRRIEPVYYALDPTRSTTQAETTNQEACAAFTEDNDVFAVASTVAGGIGASFTGCLHDARTVLVANPLTYLDEEFASRYADHLYLPGSAQSTRFSGFWIDRLASGGFFDGGRVGLLWYDDDSDIYERTISAGLRPALARHGVEIAEEFRLSSYTDSAQYSSAVLRFKAAGITHVLVLDVSSLVSFFFMAAAETQLFRPVYGLNSLSAFSFLEQNAPDAQLVGARGVGWLPSLDTSAVADGALDEPELRCLDVLRRAGQTVDGAFGRLLAFWTCDTLWFLESVLARAPTLDPAGFRAAAESLGSAYQAPGTFVTRYGPGRHDGVAAARDVGYDTACRCFAYVSDVYDVG